MASVFQYNVLLNVVCSNALVGLGALGSMNGLFQLQLVLMCIERGDILGCSEGICFATVVVWFNTTRLDHTYL